MFDIDKYITRAELFNVSVTNSSVDDAVYEVKQKLQKKYRRLPPDSAKIIRGVYKNLGIRFFSCPTTYDLFIMCLLLSYYQNSPVEFLYVLVQMEVYNTADESDSFHIIFNSGEYIVRGCVSDSSHNMKYYMCKKGDLPNV